MGTSAALGSLYGLYSAHVGRCTLGLLNSAGPALLLFVNEATCSSSTASASNVPGAEERRRPLCTMLWQLNGSALADLLGYSAAVSNPLSARCQGAALLCLRRAHMAAAPRLAGWASDAAASPAACCSCSVTVRGPPSGSCAVNSINYAAGVCTLRGYES